MATQKMGVELQSAYERLHDSLGLPYGFFPMKLEETWSGPRWVMTDPTVDNDLFREITSASSEGQMWSNIMYMQRGIALMYRHAVC